MQAHAWVEYEGKVLNDTPAVQHLYVPFQQPIELIDPLYQPPKLNL